MILGNPLRLLHDLDRTSPQFHKQLISFFGGKGHQDVVLCLQTEDLTWLGQYLDSVSLRPTSPSSTLNAGVGFYQYFRSCRPPVSGIAAQTRKGMGD